MSLPAIAPAVPCPDPFGLWEYAPLDQMLPAGMPPGQPAGMVSFGDLSAPATADGPAVWRLALQSGDPGTGKAALDRRAQRLAAIESGLEDAGKRLEDFLGERKQGSEAGPISFAIESRQPDLPAAEADLALALASVEWPVGAEEAVNFGIRETAAQLAGAVGVDWNGLAGRFNALLDGVNRQLLHAAWVETTVDNRLVARTTINWGGDLSTCLEQGLDTATLRAHQASLEQAVASEAANLKTVLTVAQLAGKIILAVTTPLGAAQALALAWQFVRTVISDQ